MKKLFLSFTATLLALSLAACAAEEIPAFNGEQRDIDITPVVLIDKTEGTEAEKPVADITVNDFEAGAEPEYAVERPKDGNENSTVTTVSSPQKAPENNDPITTSDDSVYSTSTTVGTTSDDSVNNPPTPDGITSDDSVNTTPANLNDPLPTMSFESYNASGDHVYTLQNNTECEWGYGLEPFFDKYDEEQGVWLPVEPITEITVIEIYCILMPGGSSTYTLPLEQYYGDLSAGSYRVGLLMRNHETEMAEMVWYEFSVGIDESYWRVIECY